MKQPSYVDLFGTGKPLHGAAVGWGYDDATQAAIKAKRVIDAWRKPGSKANPAKVRRLKELVAAKIATWPQSDVTKMLVKSLEGDKQ